MLKRKFFLSFWNCLLEGEKREEEQEGKEMKGEGPYVHDYLPHSLFSPFVLILTLLLSCVGGRDDEKYEEKLEEAEKTGILEGRSTEEEEEEDDVIEEMRKKNW